ncbi:uncharacterized protein UV8b_01535 [Ustilaginoidea virens]|uniref:non-specific serine/threonine protein kinase n=2 Tax=Ustilaginoidea virens TaxID=1159556 RepID=A0A8E5HLS3_USTVR|nr:uncharacterized protein UV8b_01535 [Ustilaginoidea virens]QUC17294.1 hypothetical protein UV8b_01535 [Ustilaginoidea virens]
MALPTPAEGHDERHDTADSSHFHVDMARGSSKPEEEAPAVRFASTTEEISPLFSGAEKQHGGDHTVSEVAAEQLKAFTKCLHGRPLQERRMNTFQFEAFSLPPSRVPSREDQSGESTRLPTPNSSGFDSPHGSPRLSALASPPLTPAGSGPLAEKKISRGTEDKAPSSHDPHIITPQASSTHDKSPALGERQALPHRPASSDHVARRSSSVEDHKSHRRGMFGIGSGSVPGSRDCSPSRSSASNYYSKPATPGGDANDPYAKGKRPPPQQHPTRHSIDPRFVFSRKKKHGSPGNSRTSVSEKRGSVLFGKYDEHVASDGSSGHGPHGHGSMADLKRFFRMPGHHQHHGHHHKKRDSSPASGTRTPPTSRSTTQQLPFSDDHGLSSKYGKLGRFLGAGAGGSVRLMRRKDDNTVFAVKEFRARHSYETERDYNKKVTAEFCVGSTLHHGNIIETLDILHEKGRWYEVMEYAPFDLFAIVMTGRMTREEVRCCFLQILNGVTYLHSVGLAHRDMKLDNVVVSDKGIMKIIDFGSAHVFKYPFENDSVPAKGIVGSDPYLAPEVYDSREYDAAAVDIWSLAIIFCCMTLRRFPWKIPKMTDNSFKLFASDPTPGHDPTKLISQSRSTSQSSSTVGRELGPEDEVKEKEKGHHRHHSHKANHHHGHDGKDGPDAVPGAESQSQNHDGTGERKEVIRGPWRILRLLPRESRHIIHRMLDLNPRTRAKMDEILDQDWVADTVICQQLENGEVVPADDHTHVLEPPASQQQQQSTRSTKP